MIKANLDYSRESPSQDYSELLTEYKMMHKASDGMFNGRSLVKFITIIDNFIKKYNCESLLDYGCGKAVLYTDNFKKVADVPEITKPIHEIWGIEKFKLFDPGYPEHDTLPKNELFDMVISTDVLEHIPSTDLDWVIREIFSYSSNVVFLNIACMQALKKLKDGRNAHISLYTSGEWLQFIARITEDFPYLTVYIFADEFNEDGVLETNGFKIIPRPTIIPLIKEEQPMREASDFEHKSDIVQRWD